MNPVFLVGMIDQSLWLKDALTGSSAFFMLQVSLSSHLSILFPSFFLTSLSLSSLPSSSLFLCSPSFGPPSCGLQRHQCAWESAEGLQWEMKISFNKLCLFAAAVWKAGLLPCWGGTCQVPYPRLSPRPQPQTIFYGLFQMQSLGCAASNKYLFL